MADGCLCLATQFNIADVTLAWEECERDVAGVAIGSSQQFNIVDVTFSLEQCDPGVAGGSLCLATQIDDAIKYRLQP